MEDLENLSKKKALEKNKALRESIPREITILEKKGRLFRISQYYAPEGFVTDITYRFSTEELMEKNPSKR